MMNVRNAMNSEISVCLRVFVCENTACIFDLKRDHERLVNSFYFLYTTLLFLPIHE